VRTPTPEQFRALARSSPWRWSTLRFTYSTGIRGRSWHVRASIRRPDAMRVEGLDGTVLQLEAPGFGVPRSADGVVLDADGLVAVRPPRWEDPGDDDLMYTDYRWVAMLDPVELARGADDTDAWPVAIETLTAVEHHGRPAWEAVLHPTEAYDPRCSCCPLLFSAQSDRYEAAGGHSVLDREPGLRFPDAHRVRLDVGTGVCVYAQEVGGTYPGDGHDVRIEAVDVPMPDGLFRR
jgi:hypothetical protein